MKHGLVQMRAFDPGSPISSTSMKAGDFLLAVYRAVDAHDNGPVLYFNMRQLRVSLVDKVMGDMWRKEWSGSYDECAVTQTRGEGVSGRGGDADA